MRYLPFATLTRLPGAGFLIGKATAAIVINKAVALAVERRQGQ